MAHRVVSARTVNNDFWSGKMIKFFKDESGATAIEYGLIATTMGMALIAVMPTLVSAISDRFTILASDLAGGS